MGRRDGGPQGRRDEGGQRHEGTEARRHEGADEHQQEGTEEDQATSSHAGDEGGGISSPSSLRASVPSSLSSAPTHPQTMFVSATISAEIERLARQYMHDPEKLIAPAPEERPTGENVAQDEMSPQHCDQ